MFEGDDGSTRDERREPEVAPREDRPVEPEQRELPIRPARPERPVRPQRPERSGPARSADEAPQGPGVLRLLPPDAVSEKEITVGGRKIAYTATAGTLTLFDQSGEKSAAVFYTAFIAKGAEGARRPKPGCTLGRGASQCHAGAGRSCRQLSGSRGPRGLDPSRPTAFSLHRLQRADDSAIINAAAPDAIRPSAHTTSRSSHADRSARKPR